MSVDSVVSSARVSDVAAARLSRESCDYTVHYPPNKDIPMILTTPLAGLPALLFASFTVQAASPVWLIEKDDNLLFLSGTIHLLSQADYPLPKGFDSAYQYADILVFESDIGAMKRPAFRAAAGTKTDLSGRR